MVEISQHKYVPEGNEVGGKRSGRKRGVWYGGCRGDVTAAVRRQFIMENIDHPARIELLVMIENRLFHYSRTRVLVCNSLFFVMHSVYNVIFYL